MRILFIFLFFSIFANAQKKCEYDFEINNDSINFKETKKYLVYEREFGNKTNYMFISFANDAGIPLLNIQKVQKSDQFIDTECFDKNSRIHLQLENGKIYTLAHIDSEICSARYPDIDNKSNIRVLNTTFYFLKDDYTDLKTHPITIMQIRYGAGDKISYVMENELVSKKLNTSSNPNKLFIDNFKCIE